MTAARLADGVRLRRWPGPVPDEPAGLCLVVPGRGYPATMPLLFWPATALVEDGWAVAVLEWGTPPTDPAALEALAEAALSCTLAGAPLKQADLPLLLVAKSLGTRLAPWAGRHEVAGVWLTPLLDDVRVRRAIETYPAPGLVVGGTDDPRWDGGPALTPVAADVQVWDVPGADHSLQVPSWRASVRTQCEVTDRVLALARGLPAGRAPSGPGAQVSRHWHAGCSPASSSG